MKYIIRHLLLHVLIWLPVFIYSQDCITTYGSLYGTTEGNEYGYTLAPTSAGDGFYIGGFKDDSALLVKMNLVGEVVWSRSFDIIPGKADHLNTLYLESTGDLVMGGVSGSSQSPGESGFVTRYDPDLDLIVWSKEFVPDYTYTHCWDIIEKGPGGNYIFSIDEVNTPGSNIDAQLLELNRNTGALNSATSKNYHLGSSEDLIQIELSGNFIYGVGRYSDGPAPADMRHTIVKLDANTFDQVWVRMGHQPGNVSARLYGFGLVIESGNIYSAYEGDPVGTSTTNTKLYIQKSDLDGNVVWINQYELPGNNDFGYEIIQSNGGLVVYAFQLAAPKRAILFKIDFSGVVQWSKSYQFPSASDIVSNWFGRGQLIGVGSNLIFTGWAMTAAEGTQMIVVRADLNGTVDMPCVTQQDISVPVTTLSNPTFYTVNPTVTNATPTANSESPEKVETLIVPGEECVITDTLFSFIEASICEGEVYNGYSQAGNYTDTLQGIPGSCDTIRNLTLSVTPPLLTSINASICEGQTFLGYNQTGMYSDTFQTLVGCDSVRMLNLTVSDLIMTSLFSTICPGDLYEGYGTQGTYQDTFISFLGCDSIRILDLMVEMPQIDMMVNICDGENFEGYDQPGIFIDTLYGNGNQCDTLRNLTITLLPLTITAVTESICTGQNYFGYATTGIYIDTFDVTGGCDSVRIVNLTVSDVIMTSMDRIICFGDFFEGYLAEGIYIDTFQSIGGCDSVRVLNLKVDIEQKFIEVEICGGASFEHHTSSGVYIDTIRGTGIACDTMRELILTVKAPVFDQIDYTMCEGESYLGYSQPGLYYDTLVTNKGCDSIRELHLIQIDKVEMQVSASICDDLPYKYTRPGEYVDTLISYRGCDSILTFEVIGVSHYLPNVFSPNDDGINDLFYTTFFPDEEIQLEYFAIFDRFGNMAYSTSKWPIMWNGKDQKNESFQPAVFAYVLIYTCGTNRIIEHGDITLIK